MLNTPCICLISIIVAICVIGIIIWIVFGCLNKNNNYRTFGGGVSQAFNNYFNVVKQYLYNNGTNDGNQFVQNYKNNLDSFYQQCFNGNKAGNDDDLSGNHPYIYINMCFGINADSKGSEKIKLINWFYSLFVYMAIKDVDPDTYFKNLNIQFNDRNIIPDQIPDEIKTAYQVNDYTASALNGIDVRFLFNKDAEIKELELYTGNMEFNNATNRFHILEKYDTYEPILQFLNNEKVSDYINILKNIFELNGSNDKITNFDVIIYSLFNFGIQFENKGSDNVLTNFENKLVTIAHNIEKIASIYENIKGILPIDERDKNSFDEYNMVKADYDSNTNDLKTKIDNAKNEFDKSLKELKYAKNVLNVKKEEKKQIEQECSLMKSKVESLSNNLNDELNKLPIIDSVVIDYYKELINNANNKNKYVNISKDINGLKIKEKEVEYQQTEGKKISIEIIIKYYDLVYELSKLKLSKKGREKAILSKMNNIYAYKLELLNKLNKLILDHNEYDDKRLEIDNIKNEINKIETKVNGIKTNIGTTDNQITDINNKIKTLDKELQDNLLKNNDFDTQIVQIQQQIKTKNEELEKQKQLIDKSDNKLNQLKEEIIRKGLSVEGISQGKPVDTTPKTIYKCDFNDAIYQPHVAPGFSGGRRRFTTFRYYNSTITDSINDINDIYQNIVGKNIYF